MSLDTGEPARNNGQGRPLPADSNTHESNTQTFHLNLSQALTIP